MNIVDATSTDTHLLTHAVLWFDTSEIIAEASKDPMVLTRWYHPSETRKITWNETRNEVWNTVWNVTYDATKSSIESAMHYELLWESDYQ